ncbi:hypothetical protein TNIN_4941 [Trichonephila inaurata madagascariensis]|uniref:Uncharacterized protein n=1 Tax=Trichonephila inaurata madagascariensis TaxID=2747483 RepID=A0A8X6WUI5_9ARAC|nr:hypothetical protein TNIN_4941 [Trichonephila inaurata madagascariensis]
MLRFQGHLHDDLYVDDVRGSSRSPTRDIPGISAERRTSSSSAKQRRIPSPIVTVEFIRGVLRVPKKCPAEGMGKHNSKLTREELEELEEMTNCKLKKRKSFLSSRRFI